MEMRNLLLVLLAIFLCQYISLPQPKAWRLFPKGSEFYNYSVFSIEDKDVHHFWWCQNADPYQIVDHIYYRKFLFSKKKWTAPQLALAPSEEGWDSLHICDPAVVKGEFNYQGKTYEYALFYLGTDSPEGRHNQIGVAFSQTPEGPWVKYEGNPIVEGSKRTWGVGQPSVISLDKRGKLLLFYTKQEENLATNTYMMEIDFSDMKNPKFGKPILVPTGGLKEREEGMKVILNDADFAYDPKEDVFYLVRPQHPYPLTPSGEMAIVSSHIQIARIKGEDLRSGRGEWKIIGEIGPENSGFPLNHSPSLARDWYGWLENTKQLRINFSVGNFEDFLWSYTNYGIIIPVGDGGG